MNYVGFRMGLRETKHFDKERSRNNIQLATVVLLC